MIWDSLSSSGPSFIDINTAAALSRKTSMSHRGGAGQAYKSPFVSILTFYKPSSTGKAKVQVGGGSNATRSNRQDRIGSSDCTPSSSLDLKYMFPTFLEILPVVTEFAVVFLFLVITHAAVVLRSRSQQNHPPPFRSWGSKIKDASPERELPSKRNSPGNFSRFSSR
jgi:hypothetical protein